MWNWDKVQNLQTGDNLKQNLISMLIHKKKIIDNKNEFLNTLQSLQLNVLMIHGLRNVPLNKAWTLLIFSKIPNMKGYK